MALPTVPPFLPDILGSAADTRDIPETTPSGTGQVSYQSGFPPITAVPLTAGGIAPQREDFNAVNKLFSQHLHFEQSGGTYPWQDDVDYIFGCYVLGPDNQRYTCIAANGPSTAAGAIDPSTPEGYQYWQLFDPSQTNDLLRTSTIYLNASTGDDTLDYGRGLSEDKPFKTLAAALAYGLNKFYRNNTFLTFRFAAGTYNIREQAAWFGSLSNASNIAFRGTGADTIIETEGVDFSGAHNVLMSNVFFKIYSSAGDYGIRMLSAATVNFQDYVGVQIMSEATDVKAAIGVLAASTLSCSSYGGTPYTLEVILGIADIPVFKCDSNASFLMQGPILILSGQSASCVVSVDTNSLALIYWNAQTTFNAVPKQLVKVTKNSTFVSYASTLASLPCSGTPVTVDDSSTYTGSAKSPNYNAAIRVNDVTNWESTAQMHNNIYRGANLLDGHFSSIADIMAAVRAGNFADIYVGDYFSASYTVDGSATSANFQIAGINLLQARRGYNEGKYDLCIIPQSVLGTSYMNATNTTAGGYVGSYMYTTTLPKYYKALAGSSGTPFYGYIKTVSESLSNTVDTAAAARGCSTWKGAVTNATAISACNLVLMSSTEVFGNIGWSSSQKGDEETLSMQLPIFRINPKAITAYWGGWWLRSVASSTYFCFVYTPVSTSCNIASFVYGVRPRFFIA